MVFQSDNGHSTEERAHSGGGSAGSYRGAKFSLFEGGIRLPGMISWPGRLPEGAVRDQMVHACDWMPTIAELCGAKLLDPDIDGKSLLPVLHSATAPTPHEVLHWHVGGKQDAQWAVRQGDWKLIGNARDTAGGKLSAEDKKLFLSTLRWIHRRKRTWRRTIPRWCGVCSSCMSNGLTRSRSQPHRQPPKISGGTRNDSALSWIVPSSTRASLACGQRGAVSLDISRPLLRYNPATVAGAREKKSSARRSTSSSEGAFEISTLNWCPNAKLAAKYFVNIWMRRIAIGGRKSSVI